MLFTFDSCKTIYDASSVGYTTWWPALLGILIACSGFCVLIVPYFKTVFAWPRTRLVAVIAVLFGSGFAAVLFRMTYGEYQRIHKAFVTHDYTIVAGAIRNFVPEGLDGHPPESFDVGDRHYWYSSYATTVFYHRTRRKNGTLRNGLPVRITDMHGNIARLEVGCGPTP